MIDHNQPSPVSNLTTTNHVDNDANNDEDSQYFEIHQKHNHIATEIHDTNNTTSLVQIKVHPRIFQWSPSTPTTS